MQDSPFVLPRSSLSFSFFEALGMVPMIPLREKGGGETLSFIE